MRNGGSGRYLIDRESIVLRAIEIVRDEGLAALTARTLADRLGVTASALYRHVRDKDELLSLVGDAIFAEIDLPNAGDGDWADQLELIARRARSVLLGYPGLGLRALESTQTFPVPNAQRIADAAYRLMRAGGFDEQTSVIALRALRHFSSVGLPPDLGARSQPTKHAKPVALGTQSDGSGADLDSSFDFGLRCLIFALREQAMHGPDRVLGRRSRAAD